MYLNIQCSSNSPPPPNQSMVASQLAMERVGDEIIVWGTLNHVLVESHGN